MRITLSIKRFDPQTDSAPRLQAYELEAEPTDRLLDALLYVKDHLDGTLAFRRSCAHGVCGSDAMVVNGQERLACKTLIRDVAAAEGDTVTIEPLRHVEVLRDLIVDQREFFGAYRAVKPYFIPPAEEGAVGQATRERLQSPKEREAFDDPTKCILCASCYSACPVLDGEGGFIGPAAVVQAARFNFDSRDGGFGERLAALDRPEGVWACQNHFQCTRVCPRGIKVTKNINLTKRRIEQSKGKR